MLVTLLQQYLSHSKSFSTYRNIVAVCFGVCAFLLVPHVAFAVDQFSGVNDIQTGISEKKKEVDTLRKKVEQLQKSINSRRSQAASLSNQLAILAGQVERVETEIQLAEHEIEQTDLEITQTKADITKAEKNIEEEQDVLAAFVRTLYKMDAQSELEIVLLNDSVSDFFNQFEATIQLQGNLNQSIKDLHKTKNQLAVTQRNLEDKQKSLVALKEKHEQHIIQLDQQRGARTKLLADTRSSEYRFKSQLQQAKAEQIQINADIQSLERVVRQRLESKGQSGLKQLAGVSTMIYPVPFRGVTAYFHDPSYPYRYVFEHPAVDLRASQGTPLRAATAGFVARTRDAGMGYSYIMLIHAGGISTVYGHVSKIMVQEDQFVNQGDIIGLSGGMPGTRGAGRLTTGPHLHFEVRKNGIPTNPLNYLAR